MLGDLFFAEVGDFILEIVLERRLGEGPDPVNRARSVSRRSGLPSVLPGAGMVSGCKVRHLGSLGSAVGG